MCAGLAGLRLAAAERPQRFFLEADIALARGGEARVFFDFGDGIWETSPAGRIAASPTPQTVRLELSNRPLRALRFDPVEDEQPALITGLRLVNDRGELMQRIELRDLRPMEQIKSLAPEGSGVRVVPSGPDPRLQLDFPPLQKRMHDAMRRPTVTRGIVLGLALALASIIGATAVTAWRVAGTSSFARLGGVAIFLLVLGARLTQLDWFSRAVPFWDEWEGDALYILIPFQGGFLDWGALFMTQWEHRILLTRIVTLAGTALNGEWDVRVAMTVSAFLYAATVAGLGTTLLAPRRWPGLIAAGLLAACAALPFDFNNLLWGGQTQMYGLAFFVVGLGTLAAAPHITAEIALVAFLGSTASLFTMGAGLVAPGCAVGVCLVRAAFEPAQRQRLAGLAGLFFIVALAGVWLHSSSRQHAPLYATSAAQYGKAFLGMLSWPLPAHVGCAALLWLPWIVNGVQILRRREATALEWVAVGLGCWGLVNAAALGYARPYEGPPFDSRFFTPFSLGVCGSIGASVALLLRAASPRRRVLWWLPLGAAGAGLLVLGVRGVHGARDSRESHAEFDRRIRRMLSTGDRTPVVEKPPAFTGQTVADRLESPLLQPILSAPHRRALAERSGNLASAAAITGGPVTVIVRTMMKVGPVVFLLGLIGLGAAAWRLRRPEAPRVNSMGR